MGYNDLCPSRAMDRKGNTGNKDRKGNNKVSKCKVKKSLLEGKKTKEKPANFATR